MLHLVLSRYWYRTFIPTYSATSPFNPRWKTDNCFAMLLFKSNNLCGSGRIFALPLPQKKDRFHRFRFQLPVPHPWLRDLTSKSGETSWCKTHLQSQSPTFDFHSACDLSRSTLQQVVPGIVSPSGNNEISSKSSTNSPWTTGTSSLTTERISFFSINLSARR